MKKILIAGVGNIFNGDDAFGCEVARALHLAGHREEIKVVDFGIRNYDLAYALTGRYQSVIIVDAASRGGEPGTLYLIEPEITDLAGFGESAMDAHSGDLLAVFKMAQSLGGIRGKIHLVGCEPAVLESDSGEFGLTEKVAEAVPQAIRMIDDLVADLLEGREITAAGLVAA